MSKCGNHAYDIQIFVESIILGIAQAKLTTLISNYFVTTSSNCSYAGYLAFMAVQLLGYCKAPAIWAGVGMTCAFLWGTYMSIWTVSDDNKLNCVCFIPLVNALVSSIYFFIFCLLYPNILHN